MMTGDNANQAFPLFFKHIDGKSEFMKRATTTVELFDKYACDYDEVQNATVPAYKDAISMVANTYHHYVDSGNFLDLGCGTGNLSLQILKNCPESKTFLLDGSDAMLGEALKKIDGESILGSKVVNLKEPNWHHGIETPIDAVVSSFVLEHLKEDDYRAVANRCHELIKPGGVMITVEWSDNEYGMMEWFVSRMHAHGKEHPEYKHIVEEAKEAEKHYFVNIREKMSWLEQAGFKNVHTVWQYLFGYVVVGEK